MRLRTRQQYRRMAQKPIKLSGEWIFVDIRFTSAPFSRLGITVTKSYGEAHQRNRFKRIIREAFRLTYPLLPCALDIVVRPRSKALTAVMPVIQKELLDLIHSARKVSGNGIKF